MQSRIRCSPPVALCIATLALALPGAAAAEDHMVRVVDSSFIPAMLTIQAGDTVTWANEGTAQAHNVVADDDSFRCANGCDGMGGNGNASTGPWSVTLTFDDPGTIPYYCDQHGAAGGIGMAGTVTVEESVSEPGNLRFSAGTYSVGEGAGNVTITVNRVGGDDGMVSVSYSTSNGSAMAGADYSAVNDTLQWADNDDDPKTFQVPILDDGIDESNETFSVMLSGPTGGAGLASPSTATVTITDDDAPTPMPGTIAFTAADFGADEDAGTAAVTVSRAGGSAGMVGVDYETSDGSATADDDYTPAAGTLTWADGDSASRMFEVPLLDDALEEGNETVNLALSSPTGDADLGLSAATLTIRDDDQQMEPCVADATTLCLNQDGRFRVEVRWRNAEDVTGLGQAVDIDRRDSGLFYFFQSDNIEMLVKVLDACDLPGFNTFWVLAAAVTDVEYTLTITDTVADREKIYTNVLGTPAEPVLDVAAFDTCP
jgi:plastocyanin